MRIKGGFYLKARCIKGDQIALAAPVVREVWDYLLGNANFKDVKYDGFIIKRGQLFRSYGEIRDGLKWRVGYRFERYSENQMKYTMKLLRTWGKIKLVNKPRGNLITVLNYDKYQTPQNYESTDESTDESTTFQPVANQSSLPINKKDNNDKNEKVQANLKNLPPVFIPTPSDEVKIDTGPTAISEVLATVPRSPRDLMLAGIEQAALKNKLEIEY